MYSSYELNALEGIVTRSKLHQDIFHRFSRCNDLRGQQFIMKALKRTSCLSLTSIQRMSSSIKVALKVTCIFIAYLSLISCVSPRITYSLTTADIRRNYMRYSHKVSSQNVMVLVQTYGISRSHLNHRRQNVMVKLQTYGTSRPHLNHWHQRYTASIMLQTSLVRLVTKRNNYWDDCIQEMNVAQKHITLASLATVLRVRLRLS